MSPRVKLLLGVLTALAAAYALAVLFGDVPAYGETAPSDDPLLGPLLRALNMINALGLFCVYVAMTFTSERMAAHEKVAWILGMMFFYPLALPLFWYLNVWRQAPAGSRRVPPAV